MPDPAFKPKLSSAVMEALRKANKAGDDMQSLVVDRGQCTMANHTELVLAYWSLAFEIHRGIICLINQGFVGAAFALIRSNVEAVIRAHVAFIGAPEDIALLKQDEYRTNFKKVGIQIDEFFKTDTLMQDFLDRSRDLLHSFTHAGTYQLNRRYFNGELNPTFSDGEVIGLLNVSTSAVFLANNALTKHLALEEQWVQNNEIYCAWSKG
jgi:hypothetical protein